MSKSRIRLGVLLAAVGMVVAACAAGPNVAQAGGGDVAGFWLGLWHGVISPITFLVSLFNDHVNIYEVHNNGNWYNFGFMIGISIVFSGAGRSGAAARPRGRSRSGRGRRATG
jgi:hypothetical protein